MTNEFVIKLLSLILLVAVLAGALFGCFDYDVDFTTKPSQNSTTKPSGGSITTTKDPDIWEDYFSEHKDTDNDGYCDDCNIDVVETIDFYNFNDLHGKLEDGDSHPGVDELTTYLENRVEIDDHVVILSTGDMWQGGPASNGTHGRIITDWMNYLGVEAMALGNHEFDWGIDAIKENKEIAEFPFLAINIYDNATNQRADFCEPSVMIERGGAQIGIIGAIGDCYSSIASDMTQGVNFKVGNELTNLVKAESRRLREAGADVIIYLIHDGTSYKNVDVTDYYDLSLSSGGYVDVVFGGHTHSYYYLIDDYGVPHLQGGGDNEKGMTRVEIDVNFANGEVSVNSLGYVQHSQCSSLEGSAIVDDLIEKYWDEIGWIFEVLGYNARTRYSSTIQSTVAKLYYDAGVEKWGDEYDIVLAGGSLNLRSPYEIPAGNVEYGDIQSILPFDNPLYLCSIKGSDLKAKFLNNNNYVTYSTVSYSQINDNAIYYIIADSWTALYDWAKCTPIEKYDETTYARDLLAKYIQAGNWE